MRGLETEAEGARQTRRSPSHSRHNGELQSKNRRSIPFVELLRLQYLGFPGPVADVQRPTKPIRCASYPTTAGTCRKRP
jgi:hypothetical protein